MPKQRITSDDVVRKVRELTKSAISEKRSLVQATGESGNQGAQPFRNPLTTLADLIVGGADGVLRRLGVGTDGQVLTADSSAPLGVAWADQTGGTPYTDEQVRDVIAAALVAGTNVTITPNDGADTITISATGGSGGTGSGFYLYHMDITDTQPNWLVYEGTVLWT